MTFLNLLWNHKVKIIGVILAAHTQLMIELAIYAMDGYVSALTLRLTGSVGTLFSVAVAAAGWSNSTKEKVAASNAEAMSARADIAVAQAQTASAMQTAINTPPPISPTGV